MYSIMHPSDDEGLHSSDFDVSRLSEHTFFTIQRPGHNINIQKYLPELYPHISVDTFLCFVTWLITRSRSMRNSAVLRGVFSSGSPICFLWRISRWHISTRNRQKFITNVLIESKNENLDINWKGFFMYEYRKTLQLRELSENWLFHNALFWRVY